MTMLSTAASGSELTIVNPVTLFDPTSFGYSQAVIAPSGSRTVYISGQGGADAQGALSPDFTAQVTQAFANLRAALDGAGARPEHVAKLTVYIVDHEPARLGVLTAAVVEMFGLTLPTQTVVPVSSLALPGMLFEVEAVAAID